jgi:hypothetical protein
MSCNNAFLNSKYESSFSPANLSGLAIWLDGNDSNSITQSAGVVSAWLDRSPNAYNMSQATVGNRPTVESNVRNGKSSLRFTTTQALTSTAGVSLTGQQTWFLSFRPLATGNFFFFEQSTDTNSFSGSYFYGANGYFFFVNRAGTTRSIVDSSGSAMFALGQWYIVSVMMSNQSTTVTDYHWAINGLRRSGTVAAGLPANTVVSSNFYINPIARVPGSNYTGELIVYNRALTLGEIQLTERYLADKWAVPLQAPHPYTTVPSALRLFNPLDICGLSVWLDAADRRRIDVSANANRVTSWSNKAAPAQDFSMNPTGLNWATYTAIDNRGYPAISLPGAQRYISSRTDLSRAVFFSDTCTCTAFAAWDICGTLTATNAGAFGAFGVTSPTTVRAAVFFTGSTGAGFWQAGTSTGATVNIPAGSIGTPRVQAFRRNALQMIYRNFGTQTTSNNATSAPTIQSNQLYRFDMTAQANVGGKVYELLWYNRALTDIEVNSVEVYLAEKWGLRSSLTTGVPPRFTRALAPVFNPVLLSNCVLWLDAADSATMTLSGSNVTAWRDKSGNGYNATVTSGANAPILSGNSIQFRAASSQSLDIAQGFGTSLVSTTLILFFVGQRVTASGFHFFLSGATADINRVIQTGFFNDNMSLNIYSTEFNIAIPAYSASAEPTRIYSYALNTATAEQVMNGTTLQSTAGTYRLAGFLGPQLGRRYSGVNIVYHSFNISEMIGFAPIINVAQRQVVEGYLAWKWGLVGSLPNNHPYKTIPV